MGRQEERIEGKSDERMEEEDVSGLNVSLNDEMEEGGLTVVGQMKEVTRSV